MKTELNQEQFSAVEGWIKNFPITSDGSSMLSQFNKYFAPKQIPNEAVCYTKEAKHNEREMAVKEAFKQIMNDIKSPQMAFLSFNIDDFFEKLSNNEGGINNEKNTIYCGIIFYNARMFICSA